jgi:hypothetical protein
LRLLIIFFLQISEDVDAPPHHWSLSNSENDETTEGHCIWYGSCEGCIPNHADYNKAYNGPALPMDPNDAETLRSVCPELFDGIGKMTNYEVEYTYPNSTLQL